MDDPDEAAPRFAKQVGAGARRKIAARHLGPPGVWPGFRTMGLVGWSVVVPTLLGAGLGGWLDARAPGQRSWTLALLVAGLVLGCFNAWRWVSKEDRAMRRDLEEDDDADR